MVFSEIHKEMWKFVTRGLRESVECRTSYHTNVYSQCSQNGNKSSSEHQKNVTYVNNSISHRFSSFYHDFCRDSKFLSNKNKKNHNKYHAKHSWCDALSWSSVLAAGYFVCQSLCFHKKLFEVDNRKFKKWHSNLFINSQIEGVRFLRNVLLPLPANYILPINKESRISENEVLTDTNENVSKSYGPITAEKALNEAVHEFIETHETIMGEIELNYGSKAIEDERYRDAIEHFINGSELSSAGSMFNLALCYELGLGTAIDYSKAAKYYQRAASKGHADAMYNLGVFHAQGRGGLKTNLDTARTLFIEAAKKGQCQAKKALELESCFKKQKNLEYNTKCSLNATPLNQLEGNSVVTNLVNYDNLIIEDKDSSMLKSNQYTNLYKETVNSKNSTDIFLDMLGIHERSVIPLISVGESGP